jgi:hypothetical protein
MITLTSNIFDVNFEVEQLCTIPDPWSGKQQLDVGERHAEHVGVHVGIHVCAGICLVGVVVCHDPEISSEGEVEEESAHVEKGCNACGYGEEAQCVHGIG